MTDLRRSVSDEFVRGLRSGMKSGPRHGFAWTEETILYAIDLWHRRHLQAPTSEDWKCAGADHPHRSTVARVFGSWNAAIVAAGLLPRTPGHRRSPSPEERRRAASSGQPRCNSTGRWLPPENDLRALNLRESRRWLWPRSDIVTALRTWADRHGSPPRVRDWMRASATHPSRLTVVKRFGSWQTALAVAFGDASEASFESDTALSPDS